MSRIETIQRIASELRERATYDWLHIAAVWWVAKQISHAATDEETRLWAIDSLDFGVRTCGLQLGDVTSEGFVPWPGEPNETLKRMREAWPTSLPRPLMGDVCWVSAA